MFSKIPNNIQPNASEKSLEIKERTLYYARSHMKVFTKRVEITNVIF